MGFASEHALIAQLADASLRQASVHDLSAPALWHLDKVDAVRSDADKMAQVLSGVAAWPACVVESIRASLAKENGAEGIIHEFVQDHMGFHGLKDKSAQHKEAVFLLLLADGCADKLRADVTELPAAAPKSRLSKIYDTMCFAHMIYKMKRGGAGYSLYVARKECF